MNRCSTGLAVVFAVATTLSPAAPAQPLPDIESLVDGFDAHRGFHTVYWDVAKGKVWMEIEDFGEELLYVGSLAAGVGSNDIGLDRGQNTPRLACCLTDSKHLPWDDYPAVPGS